MASHGLQQRVEVLIVLHVVQKTCFHYAALDAFLVHRTLLHSLPSVRPVPLYHVPQQQQTRQLQLLVARLTVYFEQEERELGVRFAVGEVLVGDVDLFGGGRRVADGGKGLRDVGRVRTLFHLNNCI